MGYISDIYLKTTSEGFCVIEELNNNQIAAGIAEDDRLLYGFEIARTKAGCYVLTATAVKWYDEYMQVSEFYATLEKLKEYDLPFTYYEIGEEMTDISEQHNYPDGTPDEIECVYLVREIADDYGEIEDIVTSKTTE